MPGLALILLGIAFMVAEAFMPSFGILGIGGLTSFIIGSIMLIDTDMEGFVIMWPLIAGSSLVSAAIFIGAVNMALTAHRRKIITGHDMMIDAQGTVLDDFTHQGQVLIQGEIWTAHSDVPLQKGQSIQVSALNGLTVTVVKTDEFS